jgi:hypothetical protein
MTEQSVEKLQTWQKAPQLMRDVDKRLVPCCQKMIGENEPGAGLTISETSPEYLVDTDD